MLSEKEKKELLEDGRSLKRRRQFAQARNINHQGNRSLDWYIHFLAGIQKVFSPFAVSRNKTITKLNKL